ncbi:CoA transferase subunit A [Streptomyces sp. NPDC050400]|uniref:CoA transferase subunit A n=1 Tax=Streptomyces sp. NPDC050400 TaxID=3365610 RepID=UPI0037B630D7
MMTVDDVIDRLESGMTIGIGGWGSHRKPMALVRALLRSDVTDLTVVSYAGPDVPLLAAAGKIRKLVVALESPGTVPLEPRFTPAGRHGGFEVAEFDEATLMWALTAGSQRLPFIPVRTVHGPDLLRTNPALRTVTSPYGDGETLMAAPALRLDAALIHLDRADEQGNGQFLGSDPYFDDLFCEAADRAYVSCERIVETAELLKAHGPQTLLVAPHCVDGVVEAPNGAHFTSCVPDHGEDEAFRHLYAGDAGAPEKWPAWRVTGGSPSAGRGPARR